MLSSPCIELLEVTGQGLYGLGPKLAQRAVLPTEFNGYKDNANDVPWPTTILSDQDLADGNDWYRSAGSGLKGTSDNLASKRLVLGQDVLSASQQANNLATCSCTGPLPRAFFAIGPGLPARKAAR
jgi:hypothetical protein